ncbi:hypothetical protein [Flavobacterium sp. FlaQc-48]|uniref:hypothetical protein n=1 Tax=Flavobacterium sp. FlaQc-48 TaxID=3374181 RepID=UPI0037566E89
MSKKYSEIFTDEFLTALSNWQNGWSENQERRREIADILVEQCEKLPEEFKTYNLPCYRKRFIIEGEIVPILLNNNLFEGIASWTTDESYVRDFKGYVKPSTKFAMVFKHKPKKDEIVVNINSLWENKEFIASSENFKERKSSEAKALFNFQDFQSEIVLRSTLKGSEIEDIIGISSSFDEICDMARIPEEDREDFSIEYSRNPEGIPIELPVFAGKKGTQEAVRNTIAKFTELIAYATSNNIPLNMGTHRVHDGDLRHK